MRKTLDDPMWVVGCIDHAGEIRARVCEPFGSSMHGEAESKGKRWRWNLWAQDWGPVLGCSQLTEEELFLVSDWLEKKGHKQA